VTGLCTMCERTIYLDADQEAICPVCSSPVVTRGDPEVIDLESDERPAVPGRTGSDLLEALTEWVREHHRRGGDFPADALAEAEEAALDALRSGYSVEKSFQAGRSAYFNAIDDSGPPSRRRRTDSQNMPEDAHDTG